MSDDRFADLSPKPGPPQKLYFVTNGKKKRGERPNVGGVSKGMRVMVHGQMTKASNK